MHISMSPAASNRFHVALLATAALSAAGCGGSDVDREDLTGAVTFAGQPVVFGNIEFVPDSEKGHSGPTGYADIVDGRYDTSLEGGAGVVAGPHLVRVTAYQEVPPPASEDETAPSNAKPPMFFGYPIEADLEGGVKDFDVPEDARGFGLSGGQSRRPANEP